MPIEGGKEKKLMGGINDGGRKRRRTRSRARKGKTYKGGIIDGGRKKKTMRRRRR